MTPKGPLYYLTKLFLLSWCCLTCYQCTLHQLPPALSIRLRYYYHPPVEQTAQLSLAIQWWLSYLGATLPPSQWGKVITWENDQVLELDLTQVGLPQQSLNDWQQLLDYIQNHPSYQAQNSLDLGRFVMLTLNSSPHYYRLTGALPNFEAFLAAYPLEDSILIDLASGNSSIANGRRILQQSQLQAPIPKTAFVAFEGIDSCLQTPWKASEIEVMDILPNGQPRFAIYDAQGALKGAVDPLKGSAGKPSKCLWCHESKALPNFVGLAPQSAVFNQQISYYNSNLYDYRNALESALDFEDLQAHGLGEFLYVYFMEPNISRLTQEWSCSTTEAQQRVQQLTSFSNSEYPVLGNVYHRASIDSISYQLTGIEPIAVSTNAREASFYEPEF